jgi:hypothetical protein
MTQIAEQMLGKIVYLDYFGNAMTGVRQLPYHLMQRSLQQLEF